GRGGNGWASYLCGSTYGSVTAPLSLGSGGRSGTGGKGGSAIRLNVAGTLTVNGTVSANAGDPSAQGTINTGGSSGGSVWIVTDSLAGSGSITAHGGKGINGGGGGGGGRISLAWTAGAGKRTFSGVIAAQGGARGGHSGTQEAGYPGTIYVPSNLLNELWNATYPVNGDIALAPGTYNIQTLHVTSNATLSCQGDYDGTPAEGSGVVIVSDNITIDEGAKISADGEGFGGNAGPGTATNAGDCSGGGGYGGAGGDGRDSTGGATYGLADQPTSLGSGGGGTYSGKGAGAVKLDVANTLTIDGMITADGITGVDWYAGGSGGSIWIICNTLAGSGTLTVHGGNGYGTCAGGGGGGRIRINEQNYTYTGTATVFGGTGLNNGNDGSIYYSASGDADGDGMPDTWELRYGLNPSIDDSLSDKDNDGLNNLGEYTRGADPTNPDMDDDGLLDGGEVAAGTDLFDPDTDGDDISDGWEVDHGFDPLDPNDPGTGVRVWDNDNANALWSDPVNWSNNTLPVSGDMVVFNATSTANCTGDAIPDNLQYILLDFGYGGSLSIEQGSVAGGSALTVTGDITVNEGNIVSEGDTTAIGSGTAGIPHGIGITISAPDITVRPLGAIHADGEGFAADAGPGNPGYSNSRSAGGSYGGRGNFGSRYRAADTYGPVDQPAALGSGGGGVNAGRGGGAIRLNVTNTLTVDGRVSANGTKGANDYAGGSGGSVWLVCDTLAGDGAISADGSRYGGGSAGGGGGGRIALQWGPGNRAFSGTISAAGGYGYRAEYGWPGTIFVPAGLWNELWNHTYPVNGDIALAPGTYDIETLHVTNNALLSCQGSDGNGPIVDNLQGAFTGVWGTSSWAPGYYGTDYHYHDPGAGTDTFTWTLPITAPGEYEIFARWTEDPTRAPDATYTVYHDGGNAAVPVDQRSSGGTWNSLGTYSFDGVDDYVELVQNANGYVIADAIMVGAPEAGAGVIINSSNVTIDEGARISANGEGFGADAGPGNPGYSNNRSAGGSYGGMGSFGSNYHPADIYGSLDKPTALGSGGGGLQAGRGGGAVRLVVTNILTVNGSISADGLRGLNDYAGGSGGSVWLQCGVLAGNGAISADGSNYGGAYGGAGGGGRISLQWGSGNRTFSG
ncbi:MAG: hypothetical protein JRI70_06065, partial [Deltaproteobacteria bacterium]|nr:hypothetical protein [Deltaproteobacteria bacterium]